MVIVVVLVAMPFVQIYNMVATGSERTDRRDFLSGRTLSLHACAPLPRRVHHHKLAVDRDFQKKHKNMFPILTQSFIQSLFPILTNPIPIVTPTIYQSSIEEKNVLGKLLRCVLFWIEVTREVDLRSAMKVCFFFSFRE